MQDHPAGYIAVGDIHGCLEQLDQVLLALNDYPDHQLVFLGDYIDGGPASDAVVTRIRSLPGVHLIGNHEISLIRVRTGAPGKTVPEHLSRVPTISDANFEWMRTRLDWIYETPQYIFVHAGLDPLRPLADQIEDDLLWSRYDGEYSDYAPRIVVHGHTGVATVQRRVNRVNVDTDAGQGGPITALVLPEWHIIQSDPTPGGSRTAELDRMKRELEELRMAYPPKDDDDQHTTTHRNRGQNG